MSGAISPKDSKILCTKSGNRCALPDCRKELVIDSNSNDPAALIAEMAHIKGEKPGSARYDASMTDPERNSFENLLLLCPSCHKKIDKQPNSYSFQLLLKYKKEHEEWIIKSTTSEVMNVSFSELDIITKHLLSNIGIKNDSLTLIPPKDKIKKNGLSNSTAQQILIGMTQVIQVSEFIEKTSAISPGFSDSLINGFVTEYQRLRDLENEVGDNLFDRLVDFSCNSSSNFKQRAAGLSVLVYLFEKCEVFEK